MATMIITVEGDHIRNLLAKTVATICREMIDFEDTLSVEGLLSIIVDNKKVLNVLMRENLSKDTVTKQKDTGHVDTGHVNARETVTGAGRVCPKSSPRQPGTKDTVSGKDVAINDTKHNKAYPAEQPVVPECIQSSNRVSSTGNEKDQMLADDSPNQSLRGDIDKEDYNQLWTGNSTATGGCIRHQHEVPSSHAVLLPSTAVTTTSGGLDKRSTAEDQEDGNSKNPRVTVSGEQTDDAHHDQLQHLKDHPQQQRYNMYNTEHPADWLRKSLNHVEQPASHVQLQSDNLLRQPADSVDQSVNKMSQPKEHIQKPVDLPQRQPLNDRMLHSWNQMQQSSALRRHSAEHVDQPAGRCVLPEPRDMRVYKQQSGNTSREPIPTIRPSIRGCCGGPPPDLKVEEEAEDEMEEDENEELDMDTSKAQKRPDWNGPQIIKREPCEPGGSSLQSSTDLYYRSDRIAFPVSPYMNVEGLQANCSWSPRAGTTCVTKCNLICAPVNESITGDKALVPITECSNGCQSTCSCCSRLAWARYRDAIRARKCRKRRGFPCKLDDDADGKCMPPSKQTPQKPCDSSCPCCQILQARKSNAKVRRQVYYQRQRDRQRRTGSDDMCQWQDDSTPSDQT